MLKSVLVTGASSGIGEATSLALAGKGFRVFAGARSAEKRAALEGRGGGRITPVPLDVTDEASIAGALETIAASGAPLFGLINNAGVSVTGPIEELSAGDWRRQFETNLFGAVAMIRAVLPQMREAREGRIVNIGSIAGRIASPFMGAYASSKHALEGMTDSLRRELRPFGVKVVLVRPGFIKTAFGEQEQEGFARTADGDGPYAAMAAAFRAWHAKGHPNGASPGAVAEAVEKALTAANPHSRYTAPARYLGPLFMRNTMPSAVSDRIFERVSGLDNF